MTPTLLETVRGVDTVSASAQQAFITIEGFVSFFEFSFLFSQDRQEPLVLATTVNI